MQQQEAIWAKIVKGCGKQQWLLEKNCEGVDASPIFRAVNPATPSPPLGPSGGVLAGFCVRFYMSALV